MDIQNFLGIALVGGLLSGLIQWIKDKYGAEGLNAKLLTIGLSILVGGAYFLLLGTPWWSTIIGILGAASTVYSLLLK